MLRIDNVSKTCHNGVRALSGVRLEVPREMFGLLAPNGAGKSMLMRTAHHRHPAALPLTGLAGASRVGGRRTDE